MLTRRFVTGLEIKVMSRPLFLEFTTTRGAVKLVSFDVKRTENNVQRCPKMFKDGHLAHRHELLAFDFLPAGNEWCGGCGSGCGGGWSR